MLILLSQIDKTRIQKYKHELALYRVHRISDKLCPQENNLLVPSHANFSTM